jgi:hypothetical protein
MDKDTLLEKLALYKQDGEIVILQLKNRRRYHGTITQDADTGSWQIITPQSSAPGTMVQNTINFKVDDVERIDPIGGSK